MREDWKVSCWMLGDVKDLIKVWNCEAIFPKLFLNFYQEALWSKQQWICIIGNEEVNPNQNTEEVVPNQNALEFFQMEGGFSSSCFARFHLEALNKCLLKNPPPTPSSRPRWNPPQAPTSEGSRKAAAQTPFPPPNNNQIQIQIQISTQTKIQIDELLLAFVSMGEKWYSYPCGLIRWFWAIFFKI